MRRINGDLPEDFHESFEKYVAEFLEDKRDIATRKASGLVLDKIANNLPELIGGSADLSGSNNTKHSDLSPIPRKIPLQITSTMVLENLQWQE